MKTITLTSIILVTAISGLAGCATTGEHTRRDAAIGAATGAVIGGIIGHQSGETGAGAAIGAAAGGIAGAAYGDRRDREETERENATYSADFYYDLLTEDELATLGARARASGRRDYQLTDFLTEQEKANLRRRAEASRNREIGRDY
jgi:uncharacterized membrane protein YebE (DUF533 family)